MWEDFHNKWILPWKIARQVVPQIEEARRRGTMFYGSREEITQDYDSGQILWKWIDKPERVTQIAHESLIEPFPPHSLAALEKAFADAKEPAIRFHAATILARYGRERGMDHIRAVANRGAPSDLALSAATTLALNRDTNSIPAILRLIDGTYLESADLAKALGNWPDPSLIEALERRVATDKIKAHHYAFALAKLGRDGGRVSFQHHFDWRAKQDALASRSPRNERYKNSGIRISGLEEEASAARIGMISTNVFLDHAEDIYRRGFSTDRSNYVMPGFSLAGPEISTAPLLRYLEEYVPRHMDFLVWTNTPFVPAFPGQSPPPGPSRPYPPVHFMVGAAELLAEWRVAEAVPYLRQIIPVIQKTPIRWSGKVANNITNQRLGSALFILDPENWNETLSKAGIRQEFVDRIPELAKLRPVDPGYLPKQGRLNSR